MRKAIISIYCYFFSIFTKIIEENNILLIRKMSQKMLGNLKFINITGGYVGGFIKVQQFFAFTKKGRIAFEELISKGQFINKDHQKFIDGLSKFFEKDDMVFLGVENEQKNIMVKIHSHVKERSIGDYLIKKQSKDFEENRTSAEKICLDFIQKKVTILQKTLEI